MFIIQIDGINEKTIPISMIIWSNVSKQLDKRNQISVWKLEYSEIAR